MHALSLVAVLGALPSAGFADIERVWLTHRTHDPSKIVVNWETTDPGPSIVRYGPTQEYKHEVRQDEKVRLHHVEIPLPEKDGVYHYSVTTGPHSSPDATFKGYPTRVLRVGVVANWQSQKPDLKALLKDEVHLLLTAGDNVSGYQEAAGPGVKDNTGPYRKLIDAYPALFRSTPFMPVLGNHDKEIRPRGPKPPPEPVYDIDATAYRKFFELPDDEWKWRFELPDFDVRFIALDIQHTSDMGTSWQTCHPYKKGSPQYEWCSALLNDPKPRFVVTIYNERNSDIRAQDTPPLHALFRRGTIAITGFGYFAERAEVDGFSYYNTSISGTGEKYKDPQSRFFASEDGYLLMSFEAGKQTMTVELKNLAGDVLEKMTHKGRPGSDR